MAIFCAIAIFFFLAFGFSQRIAIKPRTNTSSSDDVSSFQMNLSPAYGHLPNISAAFLPLDLTDITDVSEFCRNRPPGSYCYFASNATSCLSGTIVDCPSGILSTCKAGYICSANRTSSLNATISPMPTSAQCNLPSPMPTTMPRASSPSSRTEAPITMCSNPVQPLLTTTATIKCIYYRSTATVSTTTTTPVTTTPATTTTTAAITTNTTTAPPVVTSTQQTTSPTPTSTTAMLPIISVVSHADTL